MATGGTARTARVIRANTMYLHCQDIGEAVVHSKCQCMLTFPLHVKLSVFFVVTLYQCMLSFQCSLLLLCTNIYCSAVHLSAAARPQWQPTPLPGKEPVAVQALQEANVARTPDGEKGFDNDLHWATQPPGARDRI